MDRSRSTASADKVSVVRNGNKMLRERWCPRKKDRKSGSGRADLHSSSSVVGSPWVSLATVHRTSTSTRELVLPKGRATRLGVVVKGLRLCGSQKAAPRHYFPKLHLRFLMEFWWKFDGHSHRACAWLQAAELIQVLMAIGGSGTPFLDEAFRSFLKCGERVRLRER